MKMLFFIITGIFFLMVINCTHAYAQENNNGDLIILSSRYAPFPHEKRAEGYTYQDSLYDFKIHYNDSSVAVFIPNGFIAGATTDLVFYFHGWRNHIQKAIEKFDLTGQFASSRRNALFVFPEGPVDAPDSFGGKMEDIGVFKKLVSDILLQLKNRELIPNENPGQIVLSGHSGAYRAIAYILNRGELTDHITEVWLFDALYAQQENFLYWLDHYNGRLINIITPNGGTWDNSEDFLQDLGDWKIPYHRIDGNEIGPDDLDKAKITFVFTDLEHNQVINPYFRIFLSQSGLKEIK